MMYLTSVCIRIFSLVLRKVMSGDWEGKEEEGF